MAPRPEDLEIARSVGAQQAYPSIYGAQLSDPAKSGRANEMARRLGLPADIIEADFPGMEGEDRLRRARQRAQENPTYARMMANPRFAAAAIDDEHVEPLARATADHQRRQVEYLRRRYGSLTAPRAAAPTVANFFGGVWQSLVQGGEATRASLRQMVRDAGGGTDNGQQLKLIQRAQGRQAAATPGFKSWTMRGLYSGVSSIAYMTPGIAASVATRNPLPLMGYAAASTGVPAYGKYRARGASPSMASVGGGAEAAIEAATEMLPAGFIAGAFGKKAFGKFVSGLLIREAGGEQLATFGQDAVDTAIANPDATWAEYWAGRPQAQYETFIASMAIAAVGGPSEIARIHGERKHAQEAMSDVDRVMGAAEQSPTRAVNPNDFEEVLNQQLAGRPGEALYIPAEQITTLFQDADIREDAFWGQYADQVEEAAAIGGDVVVPLASAATHLAGSPQWQALREHVRATPGGMSMSEAKQRQAPEEMEAMAERLADEIEAKVPQLQATRAVQKFAKDLGYEGEQAQAITQLVAARLIVASRQAGIAPEEMWKRWGLSAKKTTEGKFQSGRGVLGKAHTLAQRIAEGPEDPSRRTFLTGVAATLATMALRGPLKGQRALRWQDRYAVPNWQSRLTKLSPEQEKAFQAWATETGAPVTNDYDMRGFWLTSGETARNPNDGQIHYPDRFKTPLHESFSGESQLANQDSNPPRWNHRDQLVDSEGRVLFDEREPEFLRQGARGNISLLKDESGLMTGAIIRAFENADFSTAVHELGHFWLEDLRTRATGSSDQDRADWQTVQAWFAENGHDASETIPTEAHEMWARGMERYVFEGKAPSRGLKALFAKMRDWMLETYRTVTAFNSPISPQIRDVMDRMFASGEEIAVQREEMKLAASKLEGLLSEAEQVEYQKLADDTRNEARDRIFDQVLSTLRRERTAEADARRREIQAEVEAVVDADPVFQALRILRVGMPQEDGSFVKARLSRAWLQEVYGDEFLNHLPKRVPPLFSDGDTINADELAEQVGFTSGDQMVKALVELEAQRQEMKAAGDTRSPRQAAIEETAKERVRNEIGDPFLNIEEEAQAALASDRQADLMSMELRALARKTGQRPTPWQMARQWAKGHVAAARARDAISGSALQMYARNTGKAGGNAEQALVKGNFEEAFRLKQQQMLNLALLSEGKKAKDRTEKAVRRLQKVAAKKTIASVDQDYLDQAHQLLEGVEMKTRSLTQTDKRRAFEAWYADQVAQGRDPIVPPQYQRTLGQTNWQQLTVAELGELDDVVAQIVQLGRLKQRLRDGQELRDFNDTVVEGVGQIEALRQRPKSNKMDEKKSIWLRGKAALRTADAALLKIEQLCEWLDNWAPNGLFTRLVFQRLADAQTAEHRMTDDYVKRLNAIIETVPAKQVRGWERKVDTPQLINRETGEPFEMTKDQILAIALNVGNEQNIQRLTDGYGWSRAAVDLALDEHMGAEDWSFVQGVWDLVDSFWPALQELERNVNGVAPPKVEANPVATRHGTFRGGYYPIVYDSSKSERASLDEQRDLFAPAYAKATTRAKSTNERQETVKRPLLLSLSVLNRHMGEVIHDITHREAIIEADKLTSDRRIKKAVTDAMGPEYAALFRPWLQSIANDMVSRSQSEAGIEAFFRGLNARISMVGLGFRLSSAVAQLAGTPNIIGEIGAARFSQGLGAFLVNPAAAYRRVTSLSGEMASRFTTMDKDVRDNLRSYAKSTGIMAPLNIVKRHAYDLILGMDLLITTPGWLGAHAKAEAMGMSEAEAVHYADGVIRKSQGAGGAKDQVALMRSSQAVQSFVRFYSYFSSLYNRQRDIGRRARNAESMADAYEVARRSFWIMLLPPVLDALIRGEGPSGDDDEKPEAGDWGQWLAKKVIFGNLGTIPGVRDFGSFFEKGFDYKVTPLQNIGEGITRSWTDLDKALDEDAELGNAWLKRTFTTLGLLFKLPTGYAGQEAQLGLDIVEGDEPLPDTASEWHSAITKGTVEAE